MTDNHFDVVLIGGGPGGYASALYGASAGLKIAIVEKEKVGGTCLHRGCIPAKELLETAAVFRHVGHAGEFGVQADAPGLDFSVSMQRKQKVVDQLWKGLEGLLKRRKVEIFNGTGTILGSKTVGIGGGSSGDLQITADNLIIATGSVPKTIPGFDIDGKLIVTSDELLNLSELPSTAVVIGGGIIGFEFASMMSDLGTQVTILEALPTVLPGVDPDVADVVVRSFKKRGVDVRTGVKVTGHEPSGDATTISIEGGDPVKTDMVVMCVGRRPVTEGLGLDGIGVKVDRGFVVADERCRTGADGVWAIGDVIDTPGLAHVAYAEAIVVIKDILGEDPVPVDYDRVPVCIYSHPEVAYAGLSEPAAKEAGYDVVVSKHRWAGIGRALIIGDTDGMVKLIAEKNADGTGGRLLGVHLAGPWATEQLGQGYLAVNWEATVDEVAHFIQPHPTLSELFGESMLALTGRSLHA
ncbi:MAG: dihydrolipoyl dehydrogenase [Acidimicrobiales bacterium]